MAKLFYGPDYASISVVADGDKPSRNDIEITAEQALAVAASQIATMLQNIHSSLDEIAAQLPGRK